MFSGVNEEDPFRCSFKPLFSARCMKRPCAKKHLKKPAATTRWKCKASLSRSSLDRDGVKEEIRKWASQVSGQLIDIRLSQHDNRPDHYRYTWNCASCLNCNFRGVGTYDVTSEVLWMQCITHL